MADSSVPKPSAPIAAQVAQESAENIAEALTISERRYRRLFEAARDGILILDSDQGIITRQPLHDRTARLLHDELLGKQLWEIGLLQDKAASQEAFRQLMQEGYIRYENLPLENQHGERRHVEFVSNLYRENGHLVIQCNIRDITARKRSEEALQESEERLRLATEGAGIGVWKRNSTTNEVTWTRRCFEIFGLPTDGSMNFPAELVWNLIHPDDVDGLRTFMERSDREGTTFSYEHRILVPSGETRWIHVTGMPYYDEQGRFVRAEGVLSDITERKRMEADFAAVAAAAADHRRHAAVLEERTRLAREIHDILAQGCAGITVQLEAAEAALENIPEFTNVSEPASADGLAVYQVQMEKVRARIGKARDLARANLTEARRSIEALRSSSLEANSLSEALADLLTQMVRGTAMKSQYVLTGVPRPLPDDIEHCLLRIGQEAIANAVEHAQASEVTMELAFDLEQVRLRVHDNGRGFDTDLAHAGRFGMIGMKERAQRVGGTLSIVSSPEQGTDIELIVPVL